MSKHHKPFVVRGLNLAAAGDFTSFDVLANLPGFVEQTVNKEHEAIVAMLTGDLSKMSAHVVAADGNYVVATPMNPPAGKPIELTTLDIRVKTLATEAAQLRPYRSEIREVLKRWAEKCRVAGKRGWRLSAIKTPTFEAVNGEVIIRTRVILGSAVFYNARRVTIGVPNEQAVFDEDVKNLKNHLELALNGEFKSFSYNHSVWGKGTL